MINEYDFTDVNNKHGVVLWLATCQTAYGLCPAARPQTGIVQINNGDEALLYLRCFKKLKCSDTDEIHNALFHKLLAFFLCFLCVSGLE